MKSILIISPEEWNGHFVSKHHYAINLAKRGAKVYFLNPPNNILKDINVIATEYKNLFNIQAPQVAKGLQYMPRMIRNKLERKWLNNLEFKIGVKIDTVWLFENSRFYDMGFAQDRLKIYHQMDYNQNFHVKEASQSSDICFCISNAIKNNLLNYVSENKVNVLGHGLSINKTLQKLSEDEIRRFEKFDINAIYVGNMDSIYVYIEIFEEIAKSFKNVGFHFIGSYNEDKEFYKKLSKHSNVTFWGRVESKKIIPILSFIDINLFADKLTTKEDRLQNTNSHKMLEYLYSGKVTVSTYLADLVNISGLIQMTQEEFDVINFVKLFKYTIDNLESINSNILQERRRKYALDRTYENRLKQIFEILKSSNLIGGENVIKV